MSEIFISYRREDVSWATVLATAIQQEVETPFLDVDAIDAGERFDLVLEEALQDCQVMFIIIGPGWLSQDNLDKLNKENDWVRWELLTALKRKPAIRIVPLFFGDAKPPPAEALPEELRSVLLHQGAVISPDGRRHQDLAGLMKQLSAWLIRRAIRHAPPASLDVLPYLCNRIEQEEKLHALITGAAGGTRTFHCIAHGHKLEAHSGFLDRLKHSRFLEERFKAHGTGIDDCTLEWSRSDAREGQYGEVLRKAIKNRMLKDWSASDESLRDILKSYPKPLVLVLQVAEHDCLTVGPGLLPGLISAWDAIFVTDSQVRVVPRSPLLLWIDVVYSELDTQVNTEGVVGVLPRLMPIHDAHISAWLARPEVKHHVGTRETRLRTITDNARLCCAKGQVHMMHFAEAVRKILKGR